jgi:hypothetical protein
MNQNAPATLSPKSVSHPLTLLVGVLAAVALQACGQPEDCASAACEAQLASSSSELPPSTLGSRDALPEILTELDVRVRDELAPGPADEPAPLLLEFAELGFPTTAMGQQSMRSFVVRNVGTGPVFLAHDGQQLHFDIVSAGGALEGEFVAVALGGYDPWAGLVAGNALEIGVWFAPAAVGSRKAELRLRAPDAEGTLATLALGGEGVHSGLCAWSVSASALEFGQLGVGEAASMTLTLTNEEAAGGPACELTLSTFHNTHAAFVVADRELLPAALFPGDALEVTVWFTGADVAGEYDGELLVEVLNGAPGEAVLPMHIQVIR